MGRSPCCEKVGLKRGRWIDEEDEILRKYIEANGEGCWRSLPKNAGLLRCGKSCRLRWINYLRSDLKRGNISSEEEEMIINLRASLGNRWSLIAAYLPGRTDNEIKNYWNSHLSRKIQSRRPNPNFVLPQLTAAVAAPASTKVTRRTGRRTGRSAMKVDKNSNHKISTIPKAAEQADENSNGAANGAVQMPTTPNPEKEPISRPVQRQEKNGGDNIPASLEKGEEVEIENGFLCLDDFMEDLDGLLSLDDERENRGVTENRVDEREVDFSGGDKLGPGNGEWNGLMMMSSPGNSWDDENTFSWFWECEKEKDFSDVVSLEVESDRHNAMVSWLTS